MDCVFELKRWFTKVQILLLVQALAAIPSIDNEAVQQRLDRVRTYYELLNLPYEALF